MNPKISETGGKAALAAIFVALVSAAKKYGPEILKKTIKTVLRRG